MKESTTLAFTGDIGFDHFMQNKWEDENLIDPALLDILTSSDHVIANVEGPLAGEDASTPTSGTLPTTTSWMSGRTDSK